MLKLLYIGDVVSKAGKQAVAEVLPDLIKEEGIDGVIAQAENVTAGRGMSPEDMKFLQALGVDAFTGGNWTPYIPELIPLLQDPGAPVCGPANWGEDNLPGYKYVELRGGRKVLVISLLGQVVSRNVENIGHPLARVEAILAEKEAGNVAATVVNLHGDFSSEKKMIGYYLDGRVSLAVGDHWHVPTADAQILPKGTAHMTDVGMVGSLHSSLGVSLEVTLERWRSGRVSANIWDEARPWQFNAILAEVDGRGLATAVRHIQRILR